MQEEVIVLGRVLKSFITLFVIMDPIGNIPIFIELVKGMPQKVVRRQISHTMTVASIIMALFLFFGLGLLGIFGIDITSFRIAGGIILLILGIHYVLGISHKYKRDAGYDISVPVGTPLLVGPGVITTTIILVEANGMMITLMASALTLVSTLIILRFSTKFYNIIGRHWTNVTSRVMGIILAAIAVEFIRVGVLEIITKNRGF